jgi:hypothetical protein
MPKNHPKVPEVVEVRTNTVLNRHFGHMPVCSPTHFLSTPCSLKRKIGSKSISMFFSFVNFNRPISHLNFLSFFLNLLFPITGVYILENTLPPGGGGISRCHLGENI